MSTNPAGSDVLGDRASKAKATRDELTRLRFREQDYEALVQMSDRTIERAAALDLGGPAERTLTALRKSLADVLRLTQGDASVVPPGTGELHGAALTAARWSRVLQRLGAFATWRPRLAEALALEGPAAADALLELDAAAILHMAGLHPRCDSDLGAVLDVDHWRLGLVGAVVSSPDDIPGATRQLTERLRAARTPGLLLLELTAIAWPGTRIGRVVSDSVAVGEALRLVDQTIGKHYAAVRDNTDPTLAIGLLGCASVRLLNIADAHLSLPTCLRVAALCPADDPRRRKLDHVARALGRIGLKE